MNGFSEWVKQGRRLLVIAWVLIGGVSVFALYHARTSPAAWGSVLILSVTVLVAAWYTDETRRMATATEHMAQSTLYLATKECGADLIITSPDRTIGSFDGFTGNWRGTEVYRNQVTNRGRGIAFSVQAEINALEAVDQLGDILPGQHADLPGGRDLRSDSVRLIYNDMMKSHDEQWTWRADDGSWERTS
jgi:hypothetical protein